MSPIRPRVEIETPGLKYLEKVSCSNSRITRYESPSFLCFRLGSLADYNSECPCHRHLAALSIMEFLRKTFPDIMIHFQDPGYHTLDHELLMDMRSTSNPDLVDHNTKCFEMMGIGSMIIGVCHPKLAEEKQDSRIPIRQILCDRATELPDRVAAVIF